MPHESQDRFPPGSFLSALPAEARERLLAGAVRINLPTGAVIDDGGTRVVIVLSGLIRVFIRSPDGRQVTVTYAQRGDVARLADAIEGPGPTPRSLQTMTGASVAAVRVDALRSLLDSDARVARVCTAELAAQLHRALDDIAQQSFLSVRERVARHLLDIASADGGNLRLRIGQQDLADAVGSVREVVTRTLHRLRQERLISTSRDEIVILDPIGLSRHTGERGRVQATESSPPDRQEGAGAYSPEPAEAIPSTRSAHSSRGASRQSRSRS